MKGELKMRNNQLIEKAVEITVAKLSSNSVGADEYSGEATADFLQRIYDKLVELNSDGQD